MSFKPETDDMREATSLVVIDRLLDSGCQVSVYDPVAMDECRRRFGADSPIRYATDMYDAVLDADALLLLTEWKIFRMPSWSALHKLMRHHVIIDGRNIYDVAEVRENGFTYSSIGIA